MPSYKTLHDHHHGWDNSLTPKLHINPGETISFETIDASGAQLNEHSSLPDLINLDFSKVNPVTGPIFIEGAQKGDALKVEILDFSTPSWGWTANIPGFGLLADDFKDPYLHIWKLKDATKATFLEGINIPLKAFPGTIGVAPAEAGQHSIVPPRHCGGNMDIRDLSAGTTLYLPVQVDGALFSVGDTHAAQGDGEVCGTAIESPMNLNLKFDLIKNANLPSPQFQTAGPVTRHLDEKGYYATTGVNSDLMTACKDAVKAMIEHLSKTYSLSPEDAYLLCSIACDLRISEIVDAPNWLVSFYLPLVLFA